MGGLFQRGTRALVTGAGGAIGREITLSFLREGVHVAALDLSFEKLLETAEAADGLPGEMMSIVCGVDKKNNCDAAVQQAAAKWGSLDILVNCAGIMTLRTLRNVDESEWDRTFAVNLKGPFFLTQAVYDRMKDQRYGRIVNISSDAYRGGFGQGSYGSSKGGLVSLTMTTATELAKYGVTANCVMPGLVDSEITAGIRRDDRERLAAGIPSGRLCTPEDVAYAVLCLSDDRADYITGQILHVTGGVFMG
jgi:3-oxoacyl-[acyl-carrier protein] reductase